MPLESGTRLGSYEIVAAIGAGGMGEVYRARDPKLNRDVAIKVLPAHAADHHDAHARFKREAQAVAALSHPNILAIHDFGTDAGVTYAVMELLEGETLRQRLTAGPLSARRALEVGVQIARGLAAAHGKGITHRDLKPENVWVGRDGRVKILDFGLARTMTISSADASALLTATGVTQPGTVLGTVAYMSPEQVRGEETDHRSDIFSLGVVLYEMLAGRRPFERGSPAETMSAILKEDPPELTEADRDLPPALERIVRHCLEKNPETRFQGVGDVAFALESVSEPGLRTSDRPDTLKGTPAPTRKGMPSSVKPPLWLPWIAAATGAIAIGILAFQAGRGLAVGTTGSAAGDVRFHEVVIPRQALFSARFAPDGQTILLSGALQANIPRVSVIRPEYPEPQFLTDPGVHLLSVSSKGELAVLRNAHFLSQKLFEGTLARMPMGGGAPRDVLEGVRDADWTPDGQQLAIIREVEGRDHLEYPIGSVLHASTGYLSDLRISPDGRRIAFFEHPLKWDDRGTVNVVGLDGRTTRLTDEFNSLEGIVWAPGGEEILFSPSSSTGTDRSIQAVTLSGEVRVLLRSAGGLTLSDVSRDGRWLATRDDQRSQFIVMAPGATGERDLSWKALSVWPVLSADGRTLAFVDQSAEAGPLYSVCVRGTDGSAVVRLGEGSLGDLSPDGRQVLAIVSSSPPQIVIYPTSGIGPVRRLEQGLLEAYDSASWFSDGRRVLVCGNEREAPPRCYAQSVEGGSPLAVTPGGTRQGLVSPDGRTVLAIGPDGARHLYSLDDGAIRDLPALSPDALVVRWSMDGRSLYFYQRSEVPAKLQLLHIATGRTELLREFAPAERSGILSIYSASLADDPRWYVYNPWQYISSLFVIEGVR